MEELSAKSSDVSINKAPPVHFSKHRIVKNAAVLSIVFLITSTAYECLSMLQSTLNHKKGIGVASQSITNAFFCISSLLLPKYVIKKLGCKVTLVSSMCLCVPYIVSNFYPHWALMVPSAVVSGSFLALVWASQSIYLNKIAEMYASQLVANNDCKINNKQQNTAENRSYTDLREGSISLSNKQDYNDYTVKDIIPSISGDDIPHSSSTYQHQLNTASECNISYKEDNSLVLPPISDSPSVSRKEVGAVTARFFGIFGMAYLSTRVWSSLMAYFILQKDALHSNITLNSSCVCGAQFCNVESDCFVKNLQEPSLGYRAFLAGSCVSLAVISILILVFLLDTLNDQNPTVKFSLELIFAACKHLKKKKQAFLIPITLYVGMMQGFYVGDFNVSYVGCAWGTYHVGLVGVCYGAAAGISSLSGWLVKKIGRPPIFVSAAIINGAALIVLLTWIPNAENPAMLFLEAGLWGTSLGVLWSQLKAMYGFLFKKDVEAAFAVYHLLYSLGSCLSYAYSNHLCTYMKIYILMSLLVLGIIGYLYVEISLRRQIK